METDRLKEVLELHKKWLNNEDGGVRADLSGADLSGADLSGADLSGAILREADLSGADLSGADLSGADLSGAILRGAILRGAILREANLSRANLSMANLSRADLSGANLSRANLSRANLSRADLSGANLSRADLKDAKGLLKIMGVEQGNYYWKRIDEGRDENGKQIMMNNEFQFFVGLNTLREGEVFADDGRVLCSYPGFHFASRSWCTVNYCERRYECKIRIPDDAKINEPWATDGKASADKIEIIQVFDTRDGGKDVTEQFKRS